MTRGHHYSLRYSRCDRGGATDTLDGHPDAHEQRRPGDVGDDDQRYQAGDPRRLQFEFRVVQLRAGSGDTVSLTVTATDDAFVEGPENGLTALLDDATSNATVSEAGSATVNVTDNDVATPQVTVAVAPTSVTEDGAGPGLHV